MIPKTIHYCWFGRGELPELAKKCIASWEKHCPDFEIIQWNEDNFDVESKPYTRWCYEQKKYAFLSDYVRLSVIHRHGGVYFDTDVEVLRPLSKLMEYPAFFGFENEECINTGCGFGAEAGHPAVAAMLDQYDRLRPDEGGGLWTEGLSRPEYGGPAALWAETGRQPTEGVRCRTAADGLYESLR